MPSSRADVYTVSRLTAEVRAVLESGFPLLWVEGEVSNLVRPASGHLYFTLKDACAQVRCALFRNRRNRLRALPVNGMAVRLRARLSLYEARGDFQLIVDWLEPAGEGALREAVEALKRRLAAEGLFAEARKRPLPPLPRRIGVITSPSGAAIRDCLSVLGRRLSAVEVVVYPVPVQGDQAAAALVRALAVANARRDCDLLLLVRGGGSLEDLMAFNDEAVARAVAASEIPVISGVGHEVDFSLADLAADRRAPTPSAAAELAVPDRTDLLARVEALAGRARVAMDARLARLATHLAGLERRLRLQGPAARLRQRAQRLDELRGRLLRVPRHLLGHRQHTLARLHARLAAAGPARRLERAQGRLEGLRPRLHGAMALRLERAREALAREVATLEAVSPLATLARGYAIVTRPPGGEVLRSAAGVRVGEWIGVRLHRGTLLCRVEDVSTDEKGV